MSDQPVPKLTNAYARSNLDITGILIMSAPGAKPADDPLTRLTGLELVGVSVYITIGDIAGKRDVQIWAWRDESLEENARWRSMWRDGTHEIGCFSQSANRSVTVEVGLPVREHVGLLGHLLSDRSQQGPHPSELQANKTAWQTLFPNAAKSLPQLSSIHGVVEAWCNGRSQQRLQNNLALAHYFVATKFAQDIAPWLSEVKPPTTLGDVRKHVYSLLTPPSLADAIPASVDECEDAVSDLEPYVRSVRPPVFADVEDIVELDDAGSAQKRQYKVFRHGKSTVCRMMVSLFGTAVPFTGTIIWDATPADHRAIKLMSGHFDLVADKINEGAEAPGKVSGLAGATYQVATRLHKLKGPEGEPSAIAVTVLLRTPDRENCLYAAERVCLQGRWIGSISDCFVLYDKSGSSLPHHWREALSRPNNLRHADAVSDCRVYGDVKAAMFDMNRLNLSEGGATPFTATPDAETERDLSSSDAGECSLVTVKMSRDDLRTGTIASAVERMRATPSLVRALLVQASANHLSHGLMFLPNVTTPANAAALRTGPKGPAVDCKTQITEALSHMVLAGDLRDNLIRERLVLSSIPGGLVQDTSLCTTVQGAVFPCSRDYRLAIVSASGANPLHLASDRVTIFDTTTWMQATSRDGKDVLPQISVQPGDAFLLPPSSEFGLLADCCDDGIALNIMSL